MNRLTLIQPLSSTTSRRRNRTSAVTIIPSTPGHDNSITHRSSGIPPVARLLPDESTMQPGTPPENVFSANASDISRSAVHARECMMQLTIHADSLNDLRRLVTHTCGRQLVFIRTQPVSHASKMKVWVCLDSPATDIVMDVVMRTLPSAEFGRVTYG